MAARLRITLAAALLAAWAAGVQAADFGGYVDFGVGNGSVTEDESFWWEGYTRHVSVTSQGFGLVYDVDARTSRVFDFRLRGGHDVLSLETGDEEWRLRGWTVDAQFALGGMVGQSRAIRLWAGPTLQSGYYEGELRNPSDPAIRDYEAWMLSWAVGVAAGANIPLGSRVTLCPSIGWRYAIYTGDYEYEYVTDEGTPSEMRWKESGPLDADTRVLHLTLDLLF